MLSDSDAGPTTASSRVDRAIRLGVLAIRAGYCSYAILVTAVNFNDYARPVLAVTALVMALVASGGLGLVVWARQEVNGAVAVADTAVGVFVLMLLGSALVTGDRGGSLNWALAYAVGCAIWLGLGRDWRKMFALASALGIAYAATVLAGGARNDAAVAITVFVNAVSPPVYFGTAVAVFGLVRGIAMQTDAAHATERQQRSESAALQERARVFAELHQPVVSVLELIADGTVSERVIRARAHSEAGYIRQIFSTPQGAAQPGLRTQLASLARRQARRGWTLELIDEELEREPAPALALALCEACEAILQENRIAGGGQARIRVLSTDEGSRLMVRLSGNASAYDLALQRARTRLAAVSGLVELKPALQGETRVMMEVPE